MPVKTVRSDFLQNVASQLYNLSLRANQEQNRFEKGDNKMCLIKVFA